MPNEGYKQCPFCKEKIRNEALKCRFCGEWLAEIPEVGTPPPDQDTLVSSEARNRPTSESGSLLPQKRDVFARILNSIGLGLLALCCLIIFLGLRGTSPHQADPYEVAKLLIELIVPVVICSALFGWLVRSLARKRKGFGLLSFSAACTFLVAISAQSFRAGMRQARQESQEETRRSASGTLKFSTNLWDSYGRVLSVRNISALQAIHTTTFTASNVALVLGYHDAGDRGGGLFQWRLNSTATPDGGRYLASTNTLSPAGRWERILNGETANVKMWGAKGNIDGGVTTPANVAIANDDTAAIQNALNACPGSRSSGGFWTSELLFPAGFYKVTHTLVCNASLLKIRGEGARMTHLVMPLGVEKDIFRTATADRAIAANNGTAGYDENLRIEDINFYFATRNGNYSSQSSHNANNSALVICNPDEGTTIRNVVTLGGAYGIRCFGGGGGAPAAFRDVVCSDAAIAGLCIEPVPGADHAGGHVSVTGITGDHRFDESRSNACLVKFVNFVGVALIEDLNAEAAYGGGVIQHKFPEPSSGWRFASQMGLISIRNCAANLGASFSGFPSGSDFLVLKGGQRTASVTMENINLYAGNLIRDELTGRTVPPHDAYGAGLSQGCCRVPTSYEALSSGSYVRSRLVVGDKAIYTFTPPKTGWYRVLEGFAIHGQWRLGGKLEVTSFYDSSEFNVDVLTKGGSDLAAINVVRSVKDNRGPFSPSVTKARAGVYIDGQSSPGAFVDIFVERLPSESNLQPITLAYPIFDAHNLNVSAGSTPLLAPTTPLANGNPAPSGCTLIQCVTNSLTRSDQMVLPMGHAIR